ncbi:MMPL family transporter [Streptomyces syringium]|uniref:MMPL family transporter n=1 Tax=Streptomyces syringium TaxID=76729 RepID=UPI00341B0A17
MRQSTEDADAGALRVRRWVRRLTHHNHWIVAAAALFAAVSVFAGADVAGRLSHEGWIPPGAPSAAADEQLASDFGQGAEQLALLVVADGPLDDPPVAAQGRRLVAELGSLDRVAHVASPWGPAGRGLRASDSRSAAVFVRLHGSEGAVRTASAHAVRTVTGHHGHLRVTATGESTVIAETERLSDRDLRAGELIAAPLVLIVLLLVFRSLLAALLPLAIGALAVVGTMAGLRSLTALTPVSLFALNITTALGFALAVDYSLLMVSRYREERATGSPGSEAMTVMVRTAGHTVLTSAAAVCLSLASLLFFPLPMLRSLAYGGIMVVLLAAAATLVVLPAVLALLGDHLDRWDPFRRLRRARNGPPDTGPAGPRGWRLLAHVVMRRPVLTALPALAALAALAVPFLGVRFGMYDDRILPPSSPVGQASARLRQLFDPRETHPDAVLLPGLDARADARPLADYARRASALPGVRRVDAATGSYAAGAPTPSPPHVRPAAAFISPRGTWVAVVPSVEPLSSEGSRLVGRLRALPAPVPTQVAGISGRLADAENAISSRLPLVLATTGSMIYLVLLFLTRSLLIPLKALILNALSLSAMFGAVVFIFQEGHLRWLVGGFTVSGVTDVIVPSMMFCIAFGLSMDYEVFLLSRIVEEHDRTGDTRQAVALGLERTASVFSAAALVFALVMAALATSGLILLKVVGVGLALAVLTDATLVRGVLVPAFMCVAGRANWWLPPSPRCLRRRRGPVGATPSRR